MSNDRVIIFDTTLRDGERSPGASMTGKTCEVPDAKFILNVDSIELAASGQGSGSVDATFKVIEPVANLGATLPLYSIIAITQGTDLQGEVAVRLEKGGRIVNGNGTETHIVVASYLNALNLMQVGANAHPQVAGL